MNNTDGVYQRPSDIAGDGLFTNRSFGEGSIVAYIDRALVANLTYAIQHACSWCFVFVESNDEWFQYLGVPRPALTACPGCPEVKYCSTACKDAHWNAGHDAECRVLADHGPMTNAVRATMQVLRGLRNGSPAYQALLERSSIIEEIQQDQERWVKVTQLAKDAYRWAGVAFTSGEEVAKRVMCLCLGSSIFVQSPRFNLIGSAQDPLMSTINHSCDPNAAVVWDGPKLTLRALKPLEAGQEIFISYFGEDDVSENDVFEMRQHVLKHHYRFTCKCSKCATGLQGSTDVWCKSPQLLWGEALRVSTLLSTQVLGAGANPNAQRLPVKLRPVSDDVHERRALVLEELGYCQLFGIKDMDRHSERQRFLFGTLHLLEISGLFGNSRAPLPALYNRLWSSCTGIRDRAQALLVALKICFTVDPVVYPQQYHPMRVLHTFELYSMATLELVTPSRAATWLARRGVTVEEIIKSLLPELKNSVPRSYGVGSQMMAAVNRDWETMMAASTENDLQQLQLATPQILQKIHQIARILKATPEGMKFHDNPAVIGP